MLVMSTEGQNGGRTSYFLGVFVNHVLCLFVQILGEYVSFPCLAFLQI